MAHATNARVLPICVINSTQVVCRGAQTRREVMGAFRKQADRRRGCLLPPLLSNGGQGTLGF
jgi:hypothetical protein